MYEYLQRLTTSFVWGHIYMMQWCNAIMLVHRAHEPPSKLFGGQLCVSVHFRPIYTAFYGSRKLRKKWKFANVFRNFPHVRSLWEQKVAKKVWKLSLSTIIARSGANVCKLFALQMWQKKVARRKKYRFGVRQNHALFSRVTQPIQSVVHNHTREPHTTHTTPNMDGHG